MTAKKFASDSPILKASLDLAMTANLFDPDGMLVDHGTDILKMAKKAVPLAKQISAEQAHEYEWTVGADRNLTHL
jgi:hypothetical protein